MRWTICRRCGDEVGLGRAAMYGLCKPCNRDISREGYRSAPLVETPEIDGRTCMACRLLLPAERFSRFRKHWTGLQTRCRDCDSRLQSGESTADIQLDLWGEVFPRYRLDKPRQ